MERSIRPFGKAWSASSSAWALAPDPITAKGLLVAVVLQPVGGVGVAGPLRPRSRGRPDRGRGALGGRGRRSFRGL
eukprot:2984804-Alexandrium_andersonii.AAC.1